MWDSRGKYMVTYEEREIANGVLLDTADFEDDVQNPVGVHYMHFLGSTDPDSKVAYQFFKWIAEDGCLSYENYYKKYGIVEPNEIDGIGFIWEWAHRPKTPDRLFARNFFKGVSRLVSYVDGCLEDLLKLRGLAADRYFSLGVPVRTLQVQTPPRFNPVEGWPSVNAAWVGDSLTQLDKDGHNYYLVSYATCLTCQNRLEGIDWFSSIEWVAMHNLSCMGGK